MAGAYSEASLRQNEFSYMHDHRYIRIHLEKRPPNIHNGQGHCVIRSVYMFGKAPIKFSPQTEGIK
ncbi:hypothetical protein T06_6288 [Trichinella sp. T6]|nr:hypothetical protein T06_6288 [Trichinella sp. T6]